MLASENPCSSISKNQRKFLKPGHHIAKICFLGPTIFKFPQPNWRYYTDLSGTRSFFYISRLEFKLSYKSFLSRPFYCQIFLGVLWFTQYKGYKLKIPLKFIYSEKATFFLQNLDLRFEHYYKVVVWVRNLCGYLCHPSVSVCQRQQLDSTTESPAMLPCSHIRENTKQLEF